MTFVMFGAKSRNRFIDDNFDKHGKLKGSYKNPLAVKTARQAIVNLWKGSNAPLNQDTLDTLIAGGFITKDKIITDIGYELLNNERLQ